MVESHLKVPCPFTLPGLLLSNVFQKQFQDEKNFEEDFSRKLILLQILLTFAQCRVQPLCSALISKSYIIIPPSQIYFQQRLSTKKRGGIFSSTIFRSIKYTNNSIGLFQAAPTGAGFYKTPFRFHFTKYWQ